jgi:hypothetical protein
MSPKEERLQEKTRKGQLVNASVKRQPPVRVMPHLESGRCRRTMRIVDAIEAVKIIFFHCTMANLTIHYHVTLVA